VETTGGIQKFEVMWNDVIGVDNRQDSKHLWGSEDNY
jgi:hypothetical protein